VSRGELLVLQRSERCPLSGKDESRRALRASANYLVQATSPGLAAVVGAVGTSDAQLILVENFFEELKPLVGN
jgi:hypothetical protein